LKVWNFHLSQIIFSSRTFVCGEAIKNGRKIIASQTQRACHAAAGYSQAQRLLKNMKFEGIEIAQFQIPSSFQISSSISIPSNFIFFKSLCGGESHKFKLQIYAASKKYR
jgi:hypothetical protein